jgi:hypothetical protein
VEDFSMRSRRVFSPSFIVFIFLVATPLCAFCFGSQPNWAWPAPAIGQPTHYSPIDLSFYLDPINGLQPFEGSNADPSGTVIKTPTDGGIRLDIPDKYKDRFAVWKAELLSTDFGRQQWDQYADDKSFILTITISNKKGKGAGTDKYLWDESGKFVGATITLGDELEKGYPDPIYYPVMNSLSSDDTSYSISGKILAATKLSHEIGHVNQTAKANRTFLQLQNKLMPEYTSIFLQNGRDPSDQQLVDLAKQMGGTPVEIWESREYWSEVNAMLYLKEKIRKEDFYCFVFNKIRRNLEVYAKDYEQRFDQYPEFSNSPCWK